MPSLKPSSYDRLNNCYRYAVATRDIGYNPEQVQDFIPTPGSMATAMYYSGYDPRTMEPVYVPRDPHEKAMQRALMQYRNPKNYDLVHEALVKAERTDLIGFGPKCLIRPAKGKGRPEVSRSKSNGGKGKPTVNAHGNANNSKNNSKQNGAKNGSRKDSAGAGQKQSGSQRKKTAENLKRTPKKGR